MQTLKYSFGLEQILKIQELKKRLRDKATSIRGEISNEAAAEAADAIATHFFRTWSPGRSKVVAGFWPINSEINIRPLIENLYRAGCDIVLPEVVAPSKVLLFRKWTTGAQMTKGSYKTSVLTASAAVMEPDWILVPLLAFDPERFRLGYGGGYYDVTLSQLAKKREIFTIGVAYDIQKIDVVPRESSDFQLDAILTENRVIKKEEKY
tara:strand:- start:298 stop:921 length:624 start_codon:yes stop_codon:yes gene_type:complete